jgi:hypothetical protein
VSFDIDQANQKFNSFFEEVKKASVQLNDDDDKKMRYVALVVSPFRIQSIGLDDSAQKKYLVN